MNTSLIIIIICIIVGIIVIRELFCWYFKINERNDLLEKILEELQTLNGHVPTNDSEEKDTKKSKKDKNNDKQSVSEKETDESNKDEPNKDE